MTETAPSAIALWGFNGTLPPQSGVQIGKEFNPENPPLGSTVIATFVWVGSTNIIDSVADFLWTGKRVGNRYTLAEYVTAGGISMATYVATNVQNYPVPKRVSGEELVINAYLRTSVSAGGALVAAYTGVEPVLGQALGAHRSATGTGSTMPTIAHPGAITAGAGALVYGVSMVTDGLVGRTPPPGFTFIKNYASDSPSIQFDAEYTVLASGGGGSVDPQWGWSFRSPSTWLASAIALNPAGSGGTNQPPAANFTFTCSALTCTFTSTSSDADGTIAAYNWTFGDGASSTAQNPSRTYAAPGTYTVTLTVTDNQGATGSTSRSVAVTAANQPPVANFTFTCSGLTCGFTATSSDPDGTIAGYAWTFGDGGTSTAQNPSRTYAAPGTYTVTLTVTDNQGTPDTTARSVGATAPQNQPPVASFAFSCSALTCSFTSTSSDPDGAIGAHSWSFGDGATATLQNPSHSYATGGVYTATLTVTDNQGATNATSRSVTVTQPSSTGITLDADVGTLNQQNTSILIKGFNGRHPHVGDAIVATFFWYGPPGIITSVTDVMTDVGFTPVGNTYHLVDQVSAGGISMATYVATNVQNFPDPNPDPNVVLAVRATLSQTIPDGGVILTAWTGVEPSFPAALGQVRSATGSSARDTTVGPGPIGVNSGAVAVAVTMASAPVNRDPPPGFIRFPGSVMTDLVMAIETDYAVAPAATTVDPKWFWVFSTEGGAAITWLATVFALNPAP